MPVHLGSDQQGCFAQWGTSGKKYRYKCGDDSARDKAKQKAWIQGEAVKESMKKRGKSHD